MNLLSAEMVLYVQCSLVEGKSRSCKSPQVMVAGGIADSPACGHGARWES